MRRAIDETERRRVKQAKYNKVHDISPVTVKRHLDDVMGAVLASEFITVSRDNSSTEDRLLYLDDKVFAKETAKLDVEFEN